MASREYIVHRSIVRLQVGDIRQARTDVLVSSDDYLLTMGGGVSRALLEHAGPGLFQEAQRHSPARLGDLVVTSGGASPALYILHAITIGPAAEAERLSAEQPAEDTAALLVRQVVRKALHLLPLLGCTSIAFPAIGTGLAAIPTETVVREMVGALYGALLDAPESRTVEIWLLGRFGHATDEALFASFEDYFNRSLGLQSRPAGPEGMVTLSPPRATDGSGLNIPYRLRQVFEMLRLLDARRAAFESTLLTALADGHADAQRVMATSHRQLAQLRDLRQGYEADLAKLLDRGPEWSSNAVFVSSTYEDLKEHRGALRAMIEDQLQLPFIGMEEFHPDETAPAEYIRREVEKAGIYLGVLGMRYGSIDPATGRSMTELEYRQALASQKKLCMFLLAEDAPINMGMVERSPEGYAKLLDLRQEVLATRMCAYFRDADELVAKAEDALRKVRAGTAWTHDVVAT